jgi:hypothetical protein
MRRRRLSIFDEAIDDMDIETSPAPPPPAVVLQPPPAVQQAPFVVRNLFPNIRLNPYAILQGILTFFPPTYILPLSR